MGSLLTDDYLAYIRANIAVVGAGNEWDDQVPTPVTWNQVGASTRSWIQIFALTQASNISMKLKYGPDTPPGNETEKMEILSTIISGFRYLQVEITIVDPGPSVHGMVGPFDLILKRPT